MTSSMFLGMGFFWLVPVSVIALLVWLLVSLFKGDSSKLNK